ncbi:MAG: homocysteine S-methyltransferase family protein [Clostridia bacterium]|nr:homocysteine S-methyltransferase family protein [Clostridia bacterium]
MRNGITLLDGAVGTSLWEKAEQKGIARDPVWKYNIEHPELVTELAQEYLEAGAQVILTNTFGANGPAVKRSSPYAARDVVSAGVRLVRKAIGDKAKLALAIGPLTTLLEPYGDTTEEECQEIYEAQIGAGMDEGPDCIMIQTFMDLEMMRVAATVAKQYNVPVFCTMTFEKVGKTLMGNSVKQVIDTLTPLGIHAIGMNCSLGPDLAIPVIREFAANTELPLVFKPNAGKPILSAAGDVVTNYDAETFVKDVEPALEYVSYIGGCCGCNPSYIRALRTIL